MDFVDVLYRLGPKLIHVISPPLAALVLYGICRVLVLALFHPLANFPGPKLAAVSDWWLIYHEVFLGESLTDILANLHEKYGKMLSYVSSVQS